MSKNWLSEKTDLELKTLQQQLSQIDHLDVKDAEELNAIETEIAQRQKRFKCYWGKGYYCPTCTHKKAWTEIHTSEFFTIDIGYTSLDVDLITKDLEVNHTLDLTDFLGQVHTVKRIK